MLAYETECAEVEMRYMCGTEHKNFCTCVLPRYHKGNHKALICLPDGRRLVVSFDDGIRGRVAPSAQCPEPDCVSEWGHFGPHLGQDILSLEGLSLTEAKQHVRDVVSRSRGALY